MIPKGICVHRGRTLRQLISSSEKFASGPAIQEANEFVGQLIRQLLLGSLVDPLYCSSIRMVNEEHGSTMLEALKYTHRIGITLDIEEGLRIRVHFFELGETKESFSFNLSFNLDTGALTVGGSGVISGKRMGDAVITVMG